MTTIDETAVERYFYRSMTTSIRHRSRVSAYLVERYRGSNVVARIVPLGLVHSAIGEQELAIQRLLRSLVVAGEWHTTPSRHHARMRVVLANGAKK